MIFTVLSYDRHLDASHTLNLNRQHEFMITQEKILHYSGWTWTRYRLGFSEQLKDPLKWARLQRNSHILAMEIVDSARSE